MQKTNNNYIIFGMNLLHRFIKQADSEQGQQTMNNIGLGYLKVKKELWIW